MSKIDNLIKELCPDGVIYKALWSLTTWDKRFNAVDNHKQPKVKKYFYFLANDLKPLILKNGDIKILTTSVSNVYTSSKLVDSGRIAEGEVVCIPWGGNPIVQYYNGKFITADNRICFSNDYTYFKYLYYVLTSKLDEIKTFYRGSGIKHPNMQKVLDLKIPVPPLEVQKEIVRVLDSFTELEAELEARKKQYQYYRNTLLTFNEGVKWLSMSDISVKISSGGTPKTSEPSYYNGNIPWLRTQEVDFNEIWDTDVKITESGLKNSSAKVIPANCVIVAMYGATVGKSAVNKIPLATNQACANIQVNPDVAYYRYVFHWVSYNYKKIKSLGAGSQTNINSQTVKNFRIPIPPLEKQKQIVSILDKFDALVNDISIGLPAEIEARRKQYEYYRNKLLTFKKLECSK